MDHGGKRDGSGRPKGSFNAKNAEIRDFIQLILTEGKEKFREEMMKLSGKQFIEAWTTLIEFSTPKLSRTEVKAEVENKVNLEGISKDLIDKMYNELEGGDDD